MGAAVTLCRLGYMGRGWGGCTCSAASLDDRSILIAQILDITSSKCLCGSFHSTLPRQNVHAQFVWFSLFVICDGVGKWRTTQRCAVQGTPAPSDPATCGCLEGGAWGGLAGQLWTLGAAGPPVFTRFWGAGAKSVARPRSQPPRRSCTPLKPPHLSPRQRCGVTSRPPPHSPFHTRSFSPPAVGALPSCPPPAAPTAVVGWTACSLLRIWRLGEVRAFLKASRGARRLPRPTAQRSPPTHTHSGRAQWRVSRATPLDVCNRPAGMGGWVAAPQNGGCALGGGGEEKNRSAVSPACPPSWIQCTPLQL